MKQANWQTAAATELARITGRNATLKRNTILSLVTAEMTNTPMAWGRGSGNCARSTWLDKWSKDPLVAEVRANVLRTVEEYRQEAAGTAVAEALVIIQESAADAARTVVNLLYSDNEAMRRLAAEAILDRASRITAVKREDKDTLTPEQLATLAAQAREELEQWRRELMTPAATRAD